MLRKILWQVSPTSRFRPPPRDEVGQKLTFPTIADSAFRCPQSDARLDRTLVLHPLLDPRGATIYGALALIARTRGGSRLVDEQSARIARMDANGALIGPDKELLETMKATLAIFRADLARLEKTSPGGPASLTRNEHHDMMASRAREPHDAQTGLTS